MESTALRKEVVSVGRHSLVYVVGQAMSRAVGFFMIPFYTRFIDKSDYGAMDLIEIITAACLLVISLGVGDGMSRFYYAEKEPCERNRVVSTIIIGFGIIGLPIVFLLLLISRWVCETVLENGAYAICFQTAIAAAWFGMLCEVGFTYLRMRYQAVLFVLITTAQLVAAVSLNIYFIRFMGLGILGIFCSTLITQSVIGLSLAFVILRQTGVHVSLPLLKRLTWFGLPLVPPQIGLMIGFTSNRFFLLRFAAADPAVALGQVGVFSLGNKFGQIVNRFVNAPFNSFWGPRRLELLLRDEPHAKETVARMCTYATLASVWFSLFLAATIAPVVALVVGEGYQSCYLVVPFVALAYVANGLEAHFKTGMLMQRKTIWDTWISILALAVILLWNLLFVPRYGLIGAATSNLAGFVVRVGLVYFVSQRLYPIPFELGRLGALFATATGWYVLSQLLNYPSVLLTLGARTAFVLLFPALLFCVRFYREGELEFVGRLFFKNRTSPERSCVQV